METLKCLGRTDLNVSGSFADVVLTSGTLGSDNDAALFLLTNPGQLQMFCCSSLSSSVLEEKRVSITAVDFPAAISTVKPLITVSNLFHLPNGDSSKAMSEVILCIIYVILLYNSVLSAPFFFSICFLITYCIIHILIDNQYHEIKFTSETSWAWNMAFDWWCTQSLVI